MVLDYPNILELGEDYKEVGDRVGRCEYLTWWYFWGGICLGFEA